MLFRESDHASVDWDNPDAPVVLDSHGLIAAPGETLESYAERIDELLLTRARFDASAVAGPDGTAALEAEIGFKVGAVDPMDADTLAEAADRTERLFGFRADWVPAFFPSRGLGLLWGGCTVITDSGFPVFFLRRSFRTRPKWFIYRRDELLAHELCHAVRGCLEDETYEEHFAYMTSASAFRRWTGNCFRHEWDALAFLIPVVLLLVVQLVVYSGVLSLPIWPFWIAAFAFPAFLIARNIPERRTYFTARGRLERAGFANPDAALFRMTEQEIRALAKTPEDRTEVFLQARSDAELRWQIILRRFRPAQNQKLESEPDPTEPNHDPSIPQ